MLNLNEITQETLQLVRKAQTAGWTSGTGVVGIDLQGVVSLVPRFAPFRDSLSRVGSTDGAKFTQWRALLNITNQQPDIFVGYDNAGSLVQVSEQDVQSPYVPIALAGQVTQDSVDIAKGYANAMALETMNVLNMCIVREDQALATAAQAYALPTIGTPVVSVGTAPNGISGSTTGGTIGSGSAVHVKVAARSGRNYFLGGSGVASSDASATAGTTTSTNALGAFVAAVKGAVAYDWFVGSSSSNQVYYTTTTTNTVLITTVPTAAQALPLLPDLSSVAPTTPPTADTSFTTNNFNSLLATVLGDYNTTGAIVTPGSGTSSGASWISADGAKFTINGASVPLLDTLNLAIFQATKQGPSAYMMNAQQVSDISTDVLGTSLAVTYLQPDDASGRANIAAGGYVGSYLNKAKGGERVRIEVHPGVPPGTVIARTDVVNYPSSGIASVLEVRTLRDYAQYPYGIPRIPVSGPSGPREEFEVRSVETLVNRAPVAMGVISNIANG